MSVKLELFDNTFFEWSCDLLVAKFYIDGNQLIIELTRSTLFRKVEVEIKTNHFHIIKQLSFADEFIKLRHHLDTDNQLLFAEDFIKNLRIKTNKPRKVEATQMIIYHDPKHTNGAETLLRYAQSNEMIHFKLEKVYPNPIVFSL